MRPRRLRFLGAAAATTLVAACAIARADSGDPELDARVDALASELAALRGVSLGEPIDRRILPQAELCRRLARLVPTPAPRLFALPDTGGGTLARAGAWRGYYDPVERRLYLAAGASSDDDALARDVARAVQDRHVDRRAFLRGAGSADERAARLALVEGGAAALVIERAMVQAGAGILWGDTSLQRLVRSFDEGARGPRLPLSVREPALFPYREGLAFVARIRRHHPWSRVDEVYARPPLSTAHILHPERYERYEEPDEIERGGVGLDGIYRRRHDDVIGELGLRTWLLVHGVPRARAARAAAGWGGDRFAVYAPPELLSGLWPELEVSVSAWRSEIDAIEFFEAAARGLAEHAGGPPSGRARDRITYRTAPGMISWLERRGPVVAFAVNVAPGWEETTREAIWAGWRVNDTPAGD